MEYFKKTLDELKKVKAPEKREVLMISSVVILSVLFFGLLLYFLDLLFWFVIDKLIIGF
ncbi:MAG: preprotein translocase subunit SecE [Alphaproteobacteria bacterium]|nr:preprotein translocase subunit SecE [Rickettsiales bacterium]